MAALSTHEHQALGSVSAFACFSTARHTSSRQIPQQRFTRRLQTPSLCRYDMQFTGRIPFTMGSTCDLDDAVQLVHGGGAREDGLPAQQLPQDAPCSGAEPAPIKRLDLPLAGSSWSRRKKLDCLTCLGLAGPGLVWTTGGTARTAGPHVDAICVPAGAQQDLRRAVPPRRHVVCENGAGAVVRGQLRH